MHLKLLNWRKFLRLENFFSMNCEFCSSTYGRSFVVVVNKLELVRARYARKRHDFYQIDINRWPKLYCHSKSATYFLTFIQHISLTVYSFQGPDAMALSTACDVIASSFVKMNRNKNIGLGILGRSTHFFLLRFEICANLIELSDVYELDPSIGQNILDKQMIPHSATWNMCEVCCKRATTRCKNCSTIYCSKECQKLDWVNHKKFCGEKNMRAVVDVQDFCRECR